jgi:hypothetical protein
VPVGLGPRFLIEAGFLIAVAVIAGIERLSTVAIVLVMGGAWLLVAVVEGIAARARQRTPATNDARPAAEGPAHATTEPDVAAVPATVALQPEPEPPPEAEVEPVPGPEPEPQPEETPPVEPSAPIPTEPRVSVVPTPPPEPEAEPVSTEEPESEPVVVSFAARRAPHEWNVWDLERIAKARAGGDVARDEERSYLLMYLREFANADGDLPPDFDGVVRESFGDVLDAARS